MKLNRKWVNEDFVDLSAVSDKEFVETLTVFGQKVETWERMDAEIKNVVVGKVLSMVRHPNSDHMFIQCMSFTMKKKWSTERSKKKILCRSYPRRMLIFTVRLQRQTLRLKCTI